MSAQCPLYPPKADILGVECDVRFCARSEHGILGRSPFNWNCAETNFGFGTFLERLKDHAIALGECELDNDLVSLRFWN